MCRSWEVQSPLLLWFFFYTGGAHLCSLPSSALLELWWWTCFSIWPSVDFQSSHHSYQALHRLLTPPPHSLSCCWLPVLGSLTTSFFPDPCLRFCLLLYWAHQFHGFHYRSVCWWLPCFDLQPKSIPWIPCCLLNTSLWIPNNIFWDAVCPRLNWTYDLSHKPLPVFSVRQDVS